MEKIYGYKNEDIVVLAQYLKQKKGHTLASVFEKFALEQGKAKGTVRNLYYAVAKKSVQDKTFCDKYFNGVPLKVKKGEQFNSQDEKDLIKKVLLGTNLGKSVRATIMDLAFGDAKTALRYQNKFRNALKRKPELVKQIAKEINYTGQVNPPLINAVNKAQTQKLKKEIDGLILRISTNLRKENELLKCKIETLEAENKRLISLLYERSPNDAKTFFKSAKSKEFIN